MAKFMLFGFLALLDFTLLFGRQEVKHVDFGPASRIEGVATTAKFNGFLVGDDKKRDFYLFDKRGNQLLAVRSDVKSKKYVFDGLISEPLGLVLLVGTDWEQEPREGSQRLAIRALDIETSRVRWTIQTACISYEISPDGMSLIPTMPELHDDADRNDLTGFHVIDLRQGIVHKLPFPVGAWSGAWLDSSKIVIATSIRKQLPPTELSLQLRRAGRALDSLRQELVHRDHLFRIGSITQSFYDSEVARLVTLIDTMQSRVDRLGKAVRQQDQGQGLRVLLRVVDIRSGQILARTEVASSDERGLTFPVGANQEISTLTAEPSSGDVYLYVFAGPRRTRGSILFKFNRNLEKRFEVPLEYGSLLKTIINDKVIFSVMSASGESIVDPRTGQLRSLESVGVEYAGFDPKSFFRGGEARLTRRLVLGMRFSDRNDTVDLQQSQEVLK